MLLCAKGKILLKNDKTDFTQGRILPKLAFFMLPILGALVLQAAYGAVDLLVVGRFGSTSGLSAVSTGSQVLNLVTFVVTQLAMGVTVLIARYLGEKRPQYIGQVIGGAAIVFTLLAAALFVVLVFFARFIASLMQAPAEALDLTASYVRICGSGIFFIVAYNMLSALFRGLGDSRSPLIFVLVACIVNIIGDLVLVAGFHLDAAGAAIATVAAQAVSVICAIAMLLKKELPFKIHRSDFKLNPQCKKFLGIGLPLALQEFLTQLSFLALCAFVNRLGLEASSGYGVACKIVNFAMLIPSSLMQSMASFVSQNVGAGNKKRAEQSMFTGIGIGLVFGCVVFALVWCKGDVLSSLFTADASVIANGYAYLKGFAPETIATAILFSMVGYFNGNDKTLWVMVQGLVQTLLVRLPMAYIMSIQPNASLTMIGLSAPTSTAVGIHPNLCERQLSQDEQGWQSMDGAALSCGLPHDPHHAGKALPQPGLGRVADGFPAQMDGHSLWAEEPADIPRLTEEVPNRSKRMKTLGNAVSPPQVFPILKYIANIETGRCPMGGEEP